jgi:predicted DNA-binding transcriptional regulator AlpA
VNPTLFRADVYCRDAQGIWTYSLTGLRVPGAKDITLEDRVPAVEVGHAAHGAVWVSRPLALTEPRMLELLTSLEHPPASFSLPHLIEGLPSNTPSVIVLPTQFWTRHRHEVIDLDAPELHPGAVLTIEQTATTIGVTPESLMEYVRRGSFPQPPVRLGRTPAWPRPIVDQWATQRRSPKVRCVGCGGSTEITGLVATDPADWIELMPLCRFCGEIVTSKLPRQQQGWRADVVRSLLPDSEVSSMRERS